ncbi:TPA: hypothetical protein G8O67_005456 [Salmonella enterica]|uniref:Uncharacterized protein n=1 Tax=Salmonella enterica TaxID=28901 RepID=A0A756IA34_SALER|nr:hypothetical protein [Salmonella enterica]
MSREGMPLVLTAGDDWTLSAAVRALISAQWPEVITKDAAPEEVPALLGRFPGAGVLLCLRPHEHLPWLDSLCPLLWDRTVRVVSPTVWYSDRMVLSCLGYPRAVSTDTLVAWLPGRVTQSVVSRKESHPLSGFMDEVMRGAGKSGVGQSLPEPGRMSRERTARLVREVRKESQRMLPAQVTAQQWFILCRLTEGLKGGEVALLTGLREKTVSLYRRHALCALGMEEVKSGMPLYRGVRVRESLQRYPSGAVLPENRDGQPGREARMAGQVSQMSGCTDGHPGPLKVRS